MRELDWWFLGAAVLLTAAVTLFFLYRERRLMKRLAQMLDQAMEGRFAEEAYDETLLSALESRMVRFLGRQATLEKKQEEERDRVRTLISDISHQTKTPVANLILYAQLLEEKGLPKENLSYLKALEGQAEKLSVLIGGLVKLSRLENGIIQVKPFRQPVQPLLDRVTEQIYPAAQGKGIFLEAEKTSAIACFDAKWTVEALYNLLSNAVKYTNTGGSVLVRTECYQMFCRIEVKDTGIGITEEEQAKIFTRFYRGEEAAEEEGVGIGLYLAREIVHAQGGYIRVLSQKGQGSSFFLYLPAGGEGQRSDLTKM